MIVWGIVPVWFLLSCTLLFCSSLVRQIMGISERACWFKLMKIQVAFVLLELIYRATITETWRAHVSARMCIWVLEAMWSFRVAASCMVGWAAGCELRAGVHRLCRHRASARVLIARVYLYNRQWFYRVSQIAPGFNSYNFLLPLQRECSVRVCCIKHNTQRTIRRN
jgi:hypothetical protein